MKSFSLLILLTLQAVFASDDTLVFLEDGRSNQGEKIYSRFEISADHEVAWETSGEGAFCPSIAGQFAGKIDLALHEKLISLGLKAVSEQTPAAVKNNNFSKIYIIQNGKTTKASINKGGESFETFYRTLMEIKRGLKPTKAVIMKVTKKKNEIQIHFELLGDGPFNLIFDKQRPGQFSLTPAKKASYSNRERREQVILNQKNKTHSIFLKGDFATITQVHYSNSTIVHHGSEKFPLQEIALCAEF